MTAAVPLAPHAEPDGTRLQDALRLATGLVAQVRAFGLELDLGDLDLPTAGTSPDDQARIRAAAPLYFAAELESARLLPALEMFAGLWATGGVAADLGPLGPVLVQYYRDRQTRLTAAEREALFGRLFGKPYGPDLAVESPRNLGFEPLMIELAASLSDWSASSGPWGSGVADQVRVRTAAAQLAANLATRAGGVAAFAAGELLRDIKSAVAVFKDPLVLRALGAPSMWQAVGVVIRRYLQQEVDVSSHVERARSGLALLAWLAESLPAIEAGAIANPGDEVTTHAIQWMQATLALHERGQAGAAPGMIPPGTMQRGMIPPGMVPRAMV
jgi:hypothetical protein